MARIDTCPGCKGKMHAMIGRLGCSECTGENTRKSFDERTGMLAGNLRVAALEELRVRAAVARVMNTPLSEAQMYSLPMTAFL